MVSWLVRPCVVRQTLVRLGINVDLQLIFPQSSIPTVNTAGRNRLDFDQGLRCVDHQVRTDV